MTSLKSHHLGDNMSRNRKKAFFHAASPVFPGLKEIINMIKDDLIRNSPFRR